mgnify:CR=1 FL=1
MTKILFVCTGNVFRSMIAKECAKDYAKKHEIKNTVIDSAGTRTKVQEPRPETIQRLKELGIEVVHQYKQITKEIIDANDLVVPMSTDHKEFLLKTFSLDAPLFNKIAYGKDEAILDFHEFKVGIESSPDEMKEYAYFMVNYIHKAMPDFFNNLHEWL